MAGPTYILDKTYRETDAAGVGVYCAVVQGTSDGDCKLPTAANQYAVGITQEAQPKQNENVQVRKAGISRAIAHGAISAGQPVEIASSAGDLQAASLSGSGSTLHHVVGFAESSATNAGDYLFVFLCPFVAQGS
jgi:phage tail sheath gpL-like